MSNQTNKQADLKTKREPIEISVVVLKNKTTGEVVRLISQAYATQFYKYPETSWDIALKKEKIET